MEFVKIFPIAPHGVSQRRLETAEKNLLQGATAEDEASVGLQPTSDTKGPGRGYEPTESSASKSVGVGIPSNLSGGGGGLKTTGPCGPRSPMNVDEDVRELENMFLGIEGDDPSWADGDTKSVSNNDVPGDDATSAAARELREQIDHDMQGTSVSMEGEGAAETGAGSDIAGKVFDAGKSTMQAFSIEEDEGEGAAAEKLAVGHGNSTAVRDERGTLVTTSRRRGSRRDVDSDFEDTEKLLGSIAESLTPTPGATPLEKGAIGSNTDHVSSSLAITKSELALVNLMVEAGEESGEMLATAGAGCSSTKSSTAVNFGSSDNIDTSALGGRSEKTKAPLSRGYRRANSGFDDVLIEGSTSHGSSSSINAEDGSGAVDAGVRGDTRTRDTPQVVRNDPASSSIAAETVMDSDSKSAIVSSSPAGETDVKATKNATSTLAATDTLEDIALTGVVADAPPVARSPRTVLRSEVVVGNSTEATRTSLAERHEGTMKQVFSLEHQRWVSCGFKSGLVVDMLGPASSVRAALVDAGSVLALDSLNYFLWRYLSHNPKTSNICLWSSFKIYFSCTRSTQDCKGGIIRVPSFQRVPSTQMMEFSHSLPTTPCDTRLFFPHFPLG